MRWLPCHRVARITRGLAHPPTTRGRSAAKRAGSRHLVATCSSLAFVVSLLDDIGPDARCLLGILMEAWARTDQWPIRQYVAHEMATAGLDLRDVLRELPEWDHQYQTVRALRSPNPLPNTPSELGDRIVPTVHDLVHCGRGTADQMVKSFLASVSVGYARQLAFSPDPVTVKPVTLGSDALIAGIRRQLGPFGEVSERQVRLMLAGEPATWLGVHPDPDSPDWTWNLWFGSLRPFAVETGSAYLTALEEFIGHPKPPDSGAPVEPSALPRALDHLDVVWHLIEGQRLFKRPGFARTASLAEAAGSADEFEARCSALSDVFSMLTVPEVDKVQGSLNFLKADLKQRITDLGSLERATDAVGVLQQVVKLRRGQAHSGATQDSLQAAARLGLRLTGDWPDSWDRVRHVTIEAIYALIEELDAVNA
jgi:hypothetical protein